MGSASVIPAQTDQLGTRGERVRHKTEEDMKRMKVLFGNRRLMVLLTLAILVLAATALIASSASFTATSANLSNTFTAGTLTTTADGQIAWESGRLWPGYDKDGTVGLNVDADGGACDLYLSRTAITDSADSLAATLTLTITEPTLGTVYPTAVLSAADLASGVLIEEDIPNGDYNFTFTVNFPNGDAGTFADSGDDDAYQGDVAQAAYQFKAVSQ